MKSNAFEWFLKTDAEEIVTLYEAGELKGEFLFCFNALMAMGED